MKDKKKIVLSTALALVAMFIGGAIAYKFYDGERLGIIADKNANRLVREYSPRMGSENAKVTLVEFLDPECESCRAFSPYVKELMKRFEGDMQLVIRYAPFHRNSVFAVKILEAAKKQNKYWEALDVMFKYQPNWGNHQNPQPDLLWYYLPEVGIDVDQIKKDMQDPAIEARIKQDVEDGKALQIRGTPSFFINGEPLNEFGRRQLLEAIEAEL